MKRSLGIITGSGPDAGLDFWKKFLSQNRLFLGSSFKGDLDVPNTYIHSISKLGLSMDIEKHEKEIWSILKKEIIRLAKYCDIFVITCNTLHFFENRINELPISSKFISIIETMYEHAKVNKIENFSIIGVKSVTNYNNIYSPFKQISNKYSVEILNKKLRNKIHDLSYSIKFKGVKDYHKDSLDSIVKEINSEYIYLACTELPLVKYHNRNKKIIDLTNLLVEKTIKAMYE